MNFLGGGSDRHHAFLLIASGTTLGLAGTDLVLPAVPSLPTSIGCGIASAQLVIAAFTGGTAFGLLVFGEIGPRFGRQKILITALLAYGLLSLACTFAGHIEVLIGLRFLDGIAASAPAVFAPAIIRALFNDAEATRAVGVLGSLESLVPAFAPAVGLWLLNPWGWKASFVVTAALAITLACGIAMIGRVLPLDSPNRVSSSYGKLLRSPRFLRYSLSQALVLGGLLIFVFGAPSVIVTTMHGTIADFIWMQIISVGCFILTTNVTGFLAKRFGPEPVINTGTVFATGSAVLILTYAVCGGSNPHMLIYLFAPMNVGLGLRGPPGFFLAIAAGDGDDERAASLTLLSLMTVSAVGTALVAPFLGAGLLALGVATTVSQICAALALVALPRFEAVSAGILLDGEL